MVKKEKTGGNVSEEGDQASGWNEDKAELLRVLEGLLPSFSALDKDLHAAAGGAARWLRQQAAGDESEQGKSNDE